MANPDLLDEQGDLVSNTCRVLANGGLMDTVLGPVSMRLDRSHILIRRRGPHKLGLCFSEAADVQLDDCDGNGDDLRGIYQPPSELPLHSELMRLQPEAGAVVRAHPPRRSTARYLRGGAATGVRFF